MRAAMGSKRELARALLYIALIGLFLWWPLTGLLMGSFNLLDLFAEARSWGAALMFFSGATIASATAVGGGMIFNPTLQWAFSVAGYSSLFLAILVQCMGMTSGSYGWYRKGMFAAIDKTALMRLMVLGIVCTAIFSGLLVWAWQKQIGFLPPMMKLGSLVISLYVAFLMWQEIRQERRHGERISEDWQMDGRIVVWVILGSLMNVFTAVGAGQLLFSHLIKYYQAPPRTAVAVGTLLQAVCVLTQACIMVFFMGDLVLVELLCIGLFFCMAGGRLAPYILSWPLFLPYVKPLLGLTALAMGLTTGIMLIFSL